MTEQEWLVSKDPAEMINYLLYEPETRQHMSQRTRPRQVPLASDRKLRLFTCACLLRCLFGNPWQSAGLAPVGPEWARMREPWKTPYWFAQRIYNEHRWEDLPILADMLEEAGCDSPNALAHLREPGPHARGCWVIDLLLDKEEACSYVPAVQS